MQIIAATPLEFWANHTGFEPATIAALAESRVSQGLVRAACRQRDAEWAAVLLRHRFDPALVAVLPPADADAALARLVGTAGDELLAPLFAASPTAWSPAASRAVIERLRRAGTPLARMHAGAVLASRLHPSTGPEVERWLQALPDNDQARPNVRALAHALSIRQTIAQELR